MHVDSCKQDTLNANIEAEFDCIIPKYFLNNGTYFIRPLLSIHMKKTFSNIQEEVLSFTIKINDLDNPYHTALTENNHPGMLFPILEWNTSQVKNL